jgi:hypothetical protein
VGCAILIEEVQFARFMMSSPDDESTTIACMHTFDEV